MDKTCQDRVSRSVCLFTVALLAICPGCRENEPGFEVVSLEGKIENIEMTSAETGEITIVYYSEKQKREALGIGLVTRETEIMINGAVATLKHLRPGDRVRGDVRIEKKRGKKRQTALKINVDRPGRSDVLIGHIGDERLDSTVDLHELGNQ